MAAESIARFTCDAGGARLHSVRKSLFSARFVSGHDLSRAVNGLFLSSRVGFSRERSAFCHPDTPSVKLLQLLAYRASPCTPPYNQTTLNANYTPQRVVSLQPSATVTLRDLGLLDRLVACTKYCADVCPEVADGSRLIVSDSWTAQTEQILAARPDLVLAAVPYQLEAVAAILKAGVRFLGLAPRKLADIYTDIAAIAGVMGAWETGQSVIASMQNEIEAIRKRTASASKPKVFCEEWGKPIIASQPWVAELVEAAGGEFIGEPGKTTTAEEVASAQPDVDRGGLVRSRRSRPTGEDRGAARLGGIAGGPPRAGVLHQR